MKKNFGEIVFSLKEYLILTLLVIISLILLFSNDNSQIRFLRAFAIGAFGTVQSGLSAIPNIFEIEQENKYLRESNIKLSNEISTLKETKLENIRLSKLVGLKDRSNLGVVSAKIVNKSLIQTRNTITIDIGNNDSVKINMPVITDDGLVGKVVATSGNYSIVQILYNKDLKLTVKDQRSRVDGILNYDGTGNLLMTNVPKSADVKLGDVIITSEYSNNFPPGIPVGNVVEEGNLDNLFKKVVIQPVVNFKTLEEVFVLKYLPEKERAELEKIFLNTK
ncbi:MAG TPA: rod shape-determining protein MreC [Ignavibacteria bacterium]|nr:rod shape-determining protein MreC [Ignavibacteria bacterium]